MSGGFTKAMTLTGLIAALSACGPYMIPPQRDDAPDVFWDGYLIELDGVDTSDSGIRLEIRAGRSTSDPGLFYTLETGCVGAGFVGNSGEVQAAEILRPCAVEDVPRMIRLNQISVSNPVPPPAPRASLRWAGREAILESPLGKARFTRPDMDGVTSE